MEFQTQQQGGLKKSAVYYRTRKAIADTDGFVSSCGGARSGKTISILQNLYELAACDYTPTITSIVSETFPHLKRGAIRDLPVALGDLWDETLWSKGESILRVPNRGNTESILEFFSADASSKVHGPARDRLFLNEAQNIPYDTARHLFIRTRGLKLLDYNPTHDGWMQQRVECRPECVTIHSTYKDNDYLSPEQIREIEANQADANWWRVYGLGLVGTLEGQIYPEFDLIDEMPPADGLRESYGVDFGFTFDPTAIVRVLADTGRKRLYIDEVAYERGMLNSAIAAVLAGRDISRWVHIWADAAEPKSIAEIGAACGLNVLACDKSAPVRSDRLKFQIQWMQGWRLSVTKRSLNWIKEARNYTWEKDRDGNLTDRPIDKWNHLMDATRYAAFSELAGNEGSGQYNLGYHYTAKVSYDNPLHR